MRFHLTSEQIAIQDAARGTLADHWSIERLHAFADGGSDFDPASWRALMDLGIGGILAAGSGMGLLEAVLASEIAGGAAAPGPLIGQMLTVAAIAGSPEGALHDRLPGLIAGTTVATLAFGGDLVQSARAADLFLAEDADGGLRLIEAGTGMPFTPVVSVDRSRPLSRIDLSGAGSHALSGPDDPLTARIRDAALVLVAADALGGAQHCADLSVAYAKERVQFGQPIGRFQALKHQLAQMALDVEPARALIWYAAYAWDAGLPDASRAAALAKAHLCDIYTRVTRAAIAAHGGIGYTWEYGLHYWFRRAIHDRDWLGSPAHHRARAATMAGW